MRVPYCDQCQKQMFSTHPGMDVDSLIPYSVKGRNTDRREFCSAKCLMDWATKEAGWLAAEIQPAIVVSDAMWRLETQQEPTT